MNANLYLDFKPLSLANILNIENEVNGGFIDGLKIKE